MMDDADTVNQGKWIPERQLKNVRLHHMHIRQVAGVLESGFDGVGKIHADHGPGPEPRGQMNVPALSATGVQNHLVLELFRGER